jgi:hypothetical protein
MADISEKQVKVGSKSANVTGALGHALAALFIKSAESDAEKALKQAESRKDKLKRVEALPSHADHLAFREDLEKRRLEIKMWAESLELTMQQYMDANPDQASINVELSLWLKLDKAVSYGFKPDYSKPWGEISIMATDILASVGAKGKANPSNGGAKTAGPTTKKVGRARKAVEVKAQEFVKSTLQTEDGKPVANRNLAAVIGALIADATLTELREVAAVVQKQLEAVEKAADAIKAAKGKKAAPANTKAAELPAEEVKEPIAASSKGVGRYSNGRSASLSSMKK